MNKKIAFIAIALASFSISHALASTTHLSEFNWDNPSGNNGRNTGITGKTDAFGQPLQDSGNNACTQKCPGYSMTVTECSDGYELKTCEDSACSEYHKCEATGCEPGFDTEFKDCPIEVQEDNYMCSKCAE